MGLKNTDGRHRRFDKSCDNVQRCHCLLYVTIVTSGCWPPMRVRALELTRPAGPVTFRVEHFEDTFYLIHPKTPHRLGLVPDHESLILIFSGFHMRADQQLIGCFPTSPIKGRIKIQGSVRRLGSLNCERPMIIS